MWAAKAAAAVAIAAATFTPKTTTVKDATGDVAKNPMDLVRVSLGRASNGEVRGSFTTAAGFKVKAMVAKDGIPGSVCLRLWTKTKPGGTPPDYLVCATASDAHELEQHHPALRPVAGRPPGRDQVRGGDHAARLRSDHLHRRRARERQDRGVPVATELDAVAGMTDDCCTRNLL
jgi:hypothetical protein